MGQGGIIRYMLNLDCKIYIDKKILYIINIEIEWYKNILFVFLKSVF